MDQVPADSLDALLGEYDVSALITLASFHGVVPEGSKQKKRLTTALARRLTQPDHVRAMLADLSQAERAALDAIVQHRGEASANSLHGALLAEGLVERDRHRRTTGYGPPVADWRYADSRYIDDILARLTLHGFVFGRRWQRFGGDPGLMRKLEYPLDLAIIPAEIRQVLPKPAALPATSGTAAEPGTVVESSARTLQRDLYLYWSYARDHPIGVTLRGDIHKKALVDINATLLVREEIGKGETEAQHPRLRFLRSLLTGLGVLTQQPGRGVEAVPAPDFFARPPAERVSTALETWRQGDHFSEFLVMPAEAQPSARSGNFLIPAHPSVVKARNTVVSHVEDNAAEGWISMAALTARIRRADYEFLLRRQTQAQPHYYDYGYGYAPSHPYTAWSNPMGLDFPGARDDAGGWNLVEAGFIRAVVAGPLFWLGLVDLGWEGTVEDMPTAYRLTALGRWLLADAECPPIPAEGGRVIVQPNLHIVALDPVADATLVALDHFAERLSAERAVEYQLTRGSVYGGQRSGWDVPRIKAFLEEQTGTPLPGNVARTLDEWQAQHERIVIRPRVALAHGTPEWLDALAAGEKTAALLSARPAPDVALLRDARALAPVTAALHERGVLPLVTVQPDVMPGSVVASETGAVQLAVRAPSLYLHGHLAAFADPAPGGGYQLTHSSVARAARNGLAASEILQRLAAVHRGPLPPGLERRVRAWAKHYGDAGLEGVTLLQLRDEEVLSELLADPEIGPLLQRFNPAPEGALARVRPADLERLRELLGERGIEIGPRIR